MAELRIRHDSHDLEYRNPFGAVPCDASITLRLHVSGSGSQAVSGAHLHIVDYDSDVPDIVLPMSRQHSEHKPHGSIVYYTVFTVPPKPGLLWYYFSVNLADQTLYYGNQADGRGGEGQASSEPPPGYQITVHSKDLKTPSWLKDAVVYQIFVERFLNGNEDGRVLNPKPNSLIHSHWRNTPLYIREEGTGRVTRWDFFGGNLLGVIKKLPYLKGLGVSAIYLNPIFESPSNHKYDVADYHKVDPMFGDNETLKELCVRARRLGMNVVLDGVFSHTGSDSIYFNKEGTYGSLGAYQSTDSPYIGWYRFHNYPGTYECWWGVDTMPNVNELTPSYVNFIILDDNSVTRHWQRHGIRGWRLDVADELPDEFIRLLRKTAVDADPEAVIIGEVWEDASNKISYGERRRYLLGDELDSVTNYPFRTAVIDFCLGRKSPEDIHRELMSLFENYPTHHFYSVLNMLGGHDVPRILSVLGLGRFKLALLWQLTFPGAPTIYYGDEAGMEGGVDPSNRGTYPWGDENPELMRWYRTLIALRNHYDVFRTGSWQRVYAKGTVYGYQRTIDGSKDVFGQQRKDNAAVVLINQDAENTVRVEVDLSHLKADVLLNALNDYSPVHLEEGLLVTTLGPLEGRVFIRDRWSATEAAHRESGILLHITSLPSDYGIGDLGRHAYSFVDFLHKAGQRLWQVLPLSPPGEGASPYQSVSAFAGSYLFIDPDQLVDKGLLTRGEVSEVLASHTFGPSEADFAGAGQLKELLLRRAYSRWLESGAMGSREYAEFCDQNRFWLEDYALFMALKRLFGGAPWTSWERTIAQRHERAVLTYRRALRREVLYHKFVQFEFTRQWLSLRRYANERGIRIVGDLPIFVAHDSSDVWGNRNLFHLDAGGNPTKVAGVPPDYFSETGQLWGNPLYDWDEMASANFVWWEQRFATLARYVDIIRIDHFRGFEAFWEVPAGERTAVRGTWVQAPGQRLFEKITQSLQEIQIIAEDLGYITPEVKDLKEGFGFPGMVVAQFSLDDFPAKPLSIPLYERNSVVYTGTHDNDTMLGWYRGTEAGAIDSRSDCEICWDFLDMTLSTDAAVSIVPLQDVLCLGTEARMNIPGTVGGRNWRWRFQEKDLTSQLARRLRLLTEKHAR